jgi:hypothetical protein
MRSYAGARTLFRFLEFLAWVMVVVGVLVAIGGGGAASSYGPRGAGMIAVLPGLVISVFGLLLVAQVQNARAGVDSAEYGQQMLKIARDQLEISKQALKQDAAAPQSFMDDNSRSGSSTGYTSESGTLTRRAMKRRRPEGQSDAARDDSSDTLMLSIPPGGEVIEYRNQTIVSDGGKFHIGSATYFKLDDAKQHIDNLEGGAADRLSEVEAVSLETKVPGPTMTTVTYKSKEILEENGKFKYNGIPFDSREQVEAYIDQFAPQTLPGATRAGGND